jgi:hypothetical protein
MPDRPFFVQFLQKSPMSHPIYKPSLATVSRRERLRDASAPA